MKTRTALGVLMAAIVVCAPPGAAQPSDELAAVKKELEALKEQQQRMQRQLEELATTLRALTNPARRASVLDVEPQNSILSVEGSPALGDRNAPVTVVEFSDYQCPFCARHARDTLPQIERDYIKTGKVRYVLRDFPIESRHPQAFKGHEAAHCAGEQGRYWEMHAKLFSRQKAMSAIDLRAHTTALGLDEARFEQCLSSGKHVPVVRKALADGQRAGVLGTPSFFVGLTDPNQEQVKAVLVLRGAQPYARFREAIERLLSSADRKE